MPAESRSLSIRGKTWLLVRVAERPAQVPGKTSFPILSPDGRLEVLEFDSR